MDLFYKQRLVGAILVLAFSGLVVAMSLIALSQIKKETTDNVKDSLQTILLAVQEAHNISISQRRLATLSIAALPKTKQLTHQLVELHNSKKDIVNSHALKELRQLLAYRLNSFQDKDFYLITPDRVNIASMDNTSIGIISTIHKKKKTLLDQAFTGKLTFIPTIKSLTKLGNKPPKPNSASMYVTVPIHSTDGEVIAVLAFKFETVKHFSYITKLGRIGKSGETYAFDSDGILLTESRFVFHLVKTNLIHSGQTSRMNIKVTDPGGNLLEGYKSKTPLSELPLTKMAQSATRGMNGFDMQGYRDYRGVKVLGAWVWIKQYNFGLTTEIDIDDALQPYYRTRTTFMSVMLISMILGLFMLRIIIIIQRQTRKRMLQINAELESRVDQRTMQLVKAKDELSQANEELEIFAITDSLTGLTNRRYFDLQIIKEWQRCLRNKRSISIIFFDIDYFKEFNDAYGYLAGDNCLQKIASTLKESSLFKRTGDLIARYGGEEFIILLSTNNDMHTTKLTHQLKESIDNLYIPHEKTRVKDVSSVTISVGYATEHDLESHTPESLIKKADSALYNAKKSGRNNICQYSKAQENNITNINSLSRSS